MLELPHVTLVCADTLNHALAVRALARCCERIRYGRALFLTDVDTAELALPPGVEVRTIAPLDSRDAYSILMLKGLVTHVETSHALVVQWDGYVVNPDAWTDEFLDCDYIGAPWPWKPAGSRVGNGGFSLRSRRLLEALHDPHVVLQENEDETIGVHQRPWLETHHGIRYADEDLASRFSFEVAYPVARPFGFHGLFNFCRTVPEDEIAALAPRFPDAVARSPQLLSLMRNCSAMGLWRATLAIANRMLAADAAHEEARRMRDEAQRALDRPPAVGRNDPCPCGSGKRFKQCHGLLSVAAASPPDDADTLTRKGIELHTAGRMDDAERAYAAALSIAPDHVYADHFLGVIAMQRQRYEEAIPRLERTAAIRPDEPDFHGNLGLAYAGVDRFDEAIAAQHRALAARPDNAMAWNNVGLALQETNRLGEAIDAYRRALALDPEFTRARWNLAMARLARGERGAWPDYEARLAIPELGGATVDPGVPRYRGGDVRGMTLLVDGEQGFGDMLQFVRFAPLLAARGAKVIVRAQPPIVALLRTVPGVADVVPMDARPDCDAWIPLMSLPGVLDIDPQGDATVLPYLHANPGRVAAIRAKLANDPAKHRIGLSWTGNPRQANNRRRSCPLASLAPLLNRPGVAWYSLQRQDGEEQIASVPEARSLRLLDERNDFDGKAALVDALDLVVSVCTANAHLSGALGRPTWIMLAHAPDWRWGTTSATSAWYPTARLFRQPAVGDWVSVVRDVGAALDTLMAGQ